MPTQTQLPGSQRNSNCIYSPWIRKLEMLLLCHLGFLWKSHRLSKWIRCHAMIGFLTLIFELVCYRGVSWIVPLGLWHVSTRKSSSRGNKTWPQPLSLAPPPPAQSWLQLSLSRRDSDRWSCCWALGCCQGDFSADKWHPCRNLSLPGWPFKPGKLLGGLLGSQPKPVCLHSLISSHTHCRKWSSVWE